MKQCQGYGIFWRPEKLIDWYIGSLEGRRSPWVERMLRIFPPEERAAYRGVFRRPLMPFSDEGPFSDDMYRNPQGLQAARMLFRDFQAGDRHEQGKVGDADNDLLDSPVKAQQVYQLLDSDSEYEICLLRRDAFAVNSQTLGFDIGYWGGDHFSLIADSYVVPAWRPPPPQEADTLADRLADLNQHLLFASADEAAGFRDFYRSCGWAERERYPGEFEIIQIDFVPATGVGDP